MNAHNANKATGCGKHLAIVGALAAIVAVLIGVFAWLMPFSPVGPSPFARRPTASSEQTMAPEPTYTRPDIETFAVALREDFTTLDPKIWSWRGDAKVENGVLEVTGKGKVNENVVFRSAMRYGDALLVTFRFHADTYFSMYLYDDPDGYEKPGFRLLNAHRPNQAEGSFWRIAQDTTSVDTVFKNLKPDVWLQLFLRVGKDNQVEGQIWNKSTGELITSISRQMTGDWQNQNWTFVIESISGTIEVDTYEEVVF